MKALGVLSIAFACLSLSDCKSAQPQHFAQPEAIHALGSYTHAASGMTFPSAVGDFQRVNLIRYDAEALDIGAGYNLIAPSGGIAATVYVYPAPSLVSIGSPSNVVATAKATLCRNEYERRKREVINSHPGARLLLENDVSSPQGGAVYPGKMATFEYDEVFGGQRQLLHSDLYVFCYVGEKWAFQYRFTSPKNFDAAGMIAAFMGALPWTVSAGT